MENKPRKGGMSIDELSFPFFFEEQLALPSFFILFNISFSSSFICPLSIIFSNASDISVAKLEPFGYT
jgi:hypothetical protein